MPKATTKPIATTDLTDAQAEQLAEQIIKLQASSGTQIMSSVGELLFVAVYGSNEALYHSSDPTKGQSLAKLSQQPGMADAQWGRSKLHNAVGIYLLGRTLKSFKSYPHLQVSHYLTVIGLAPARQKTLLTQAESGRWTVAQLAKAAGKQSAAAAGHHSAQAEIAQVIKQVTAWDDPKAGVAAVLSSAGVDANSISKLTQSLSDLGAVASAIDDQLKGKAQQKLHDIALKIARLGAKHGKAGKAKSARQEISQRA